jgi:erythromycin esterase-like protein
VGFHETARQHEHVLAQLNEERAGALGRISKTLESLLSQLNDSRARLADARGETRARELAVYRDLHQRASLYRWYLEVQRESLGLRQHHRLDEFYKVPAPIDQ